MVVARGWQGCVRLPADGALFRPFRDQALDAVELAQIDQRADIGVLVERAADAQPAHPHLDLGDEGVGYAFLHQQPRTGAADLALVEPDAVDQTLDGAVEIGVLEDDEGRLAAKLQRQFFAGPRGGFPDDLADFRRTGEGDLLNACMIDDRRTRFRAALDDVDDALRHAGASADLGEQDGGERRELCRLQHHRAAGGKGGRDLPGQHQQRKIPRNDLADDADALVIRKIPVQRLCPAGMVDEMADCQRHVDVAAFADRLAIVDRFQHREQALVALHGAADGVQHFRALIAGGRGPFRQGFRGGRNRRVDIGYTGIRHLGQQLAGGGIAGLESLAACGGFPVATNEQHLAEIARCQPGIGLIPRLRRRAIFHGVIAFENVHGELFREEDFDFGRRSTAPPSVLPDISPSRGEIGSFDRIANLTTLKIGESWDDIQSPPWRGRCPAGQRGARRNSTFKTLI
ncbi:hypothetical protein MESS2_1190004 [Mesorhizobium metallidurans STM 2683]|uniref:Uncharacterized protein n=1 Tax=Mesorhizobium metallidurans STM 2683 TaxID=1297569 RepID=M5EHA4_9HYPH|nr:hypothetical protein MESS2_1190004 [Mesorhizobium metallidurans STM 2683]